MYGGFFIIAHRLSEFWCPYTMCVCACIILFTKKIEKTL